MADLVALALRQDGPTGRVVVWAHDYHTSRTPISFFEAQTMGEALARRFQRGYLSVGFAFGAGEFMAEWYPAPGTTPPPGVARPGELTTFHVSAPQPRDGEYALAALAPRDDTLDLRGVTSAWMKREQTFRRYGSGYNDLWADQSRLRSTLTTTFDVLVFVHRTIAATQLEKPRARRPAVFIRRHSPHAPDRGGLVRRMTRPVALRARNWLCSVLAAAALWLTGCGPVARTIEQSPRSTVRWLPSRASIRI